jgi:HK97 family phage prohead protease
MDLQYKTLGFTVEETKQDERDGAKIGVFSGHLAAYAKDECDDIFIPGAFKNSIESHKERGNRPIRMLYQHWSDNLIGGFPIDDVKEDEVGLFVKGEINLEVQKGAEAFALMKQGVLTDMSIGFSIIDSEWREDVRILKEVEIWEGSVVSEPCNRSATIDEVKSMQFKDLPLAPKDYKFNEKSDFERVIEFSEGSTESAFLYEDENGKKLQIATVIDGKLVAVPDAIFKAAEDVKDMDIEEKDAVIAHIERYYAKMGVESPFKEEEKRFWIAAEVKELTTRQLEDAIVQSGAFSKGAAKIIAGNKSVDHKATSTDTKEKDVSLKDVLKNTIESLKKK